MLRLHRKVNVHTPHVPKRTKTHSMYDLAYPDHYVTHGGHRISARRMPVPQTVSNAVKAVEAHEPHPGILPYGGRTIKLPHPQGAQVEAISTGEVRWSANSITEYNPLLAGDK